MGELPNEENGDFKIAFAGTWEDWFRWGEGTGKPVIVHYSIDEEDKMHMRKSKYITESPVKGYIKKIKVEDSIGYKIFYEPDRKVYERDELVKRLGADKDSGYLKQALNKLPIDEVSINIPQILIGKETTKAPMPESVITANAYAQQIAEKISVETRREANGQNFDEMYLMLTAKQRGAMCAIVGSTMKNILKKQYRMTGTKEHVALLGASNTGKTALTEAVCLVCFGIDYKEPFSGGETESNFRIDSMSAATNLPILIDDALVNEKFMDLIRAKSEGGRTNRGRRDMSLTTFENEATFIITSNNPELSGELYKDEANQKRFHRFFFEGTDVIPESDRKNLRNFIDRVSSGGYVYDMLDGIGGEGLKEVYRIIIEVVGKEQLATELFGAFVLGIMDKEDIIYSSIQEGGDWKELVYDFIKAKGTSEMQRPQFEINRWLDKIRVDDEGIWVNNLFLQEMGRELGLKIKLQNLRELAKLSGQAPEDIFPAFKQGADSSGYRKRINGHVNVCAKLIEREEKVTDNGKQVTCDGKQQDTGNKGNITSNIYIILYKLLHCYLLYPPNTVQTKINSYTVVLNAKKLQSLLSPNSIDKTDVTLLPSDLQPSNTNNMSVLSDSAKTAPQPSNTNNILDTENEA